MKITEKTKLCGSIAKIPSTFGTTVYNALYEKLALDYAYYAFGTEDCEGAIQGMRALGFRFFAVSMPHKQTVMQYLDEVDETVKEIGAVNSVLNTGGRLKGYNSDWIGVSKALKEKTDISGKTVLVIGAGGAARAAVYAARKEGAEEIAIVNRSPEKAMELSRDFGVTCRSLTDLNDIHRYDIILHMTSVGMIGCDTVYPVDFGGLRKGQVIMDVVFKPPETALMKRAERAGCVVVPGYRMLMHQGIFQFELYSGKRAPVDFMEQMVLKAIGC